MKKVFRDILIDLDKNYIISKMTILDERQLINELREYLVKKRFAYFTLMMSTIMCLFKPQNA